MTTHRRPRHPLPTVLARARARIEDNARVYDPVESFPRAPLMFRDLKHLLDDSRLYADALVEILALLDDADVLTETLYGEADPVRAAARRNLTSWLRIGFWLLLPGPPR